MSTSDILYLVSGVFLALIFIVVIILLIKKKKINKLRKRLEELKRQRNLIVGTPIMVELSKIESLLKNDKLESKYDEWNERYEVLKNERYTKITDLLLEADGLIDTKKLKEAKEAIINLEMEIYKIRVSTDNLLDEIREVTMSEERNRAIVTKLKAKFRELERKFHNSEESYGDIYKYIELQFENIEKRFQDFEVIMEENDYTEVINTVKVLDEMIAHMGVVIEEVPDLVLLTTKILPTRIKEAETIYESMVEKGYPLGFLNFEYNMDQIRKKISLILDKAKILNLEDSLFELKTFIDYLDGIFNDFDIEKRSKKQFDETVKEFKTKIVSVNKIISDIYSQLDDIKSMYNLSKEDLEGLESVNKSLFEINSTYNTIISKLKNKEEAYSVLKQEIDELASSFEKAEEDLNNCLKSLGSMHEDELRAREQLNEINELLKQCKANIRHYKLPIIANNYFVELSEANEAVYEIEKELKKVPITIKTLNIRVDTARDLSFKLYNTTNDMIKTAKLSEMTIVYGNRYKPLDQDIEKGLNVASQLFFKGDYTQALETAIASINIVEPDIYKKMLDVYKTDK